MRRMGRDERGKNVSQASRLALAAIVLGSYGGVVAQEPEPEPYKLTVDVSLVVLHATVESRRGDPVGELAEENFEVYENGVRQSIRLFRHEDTPVAVGLVIDHSRSMQPKLSQVIAAGESFVQSSNPQDQMFVANFSDRVSLGLPSGVAFTNSAAEIRTAMARAPAPGMTSLYDGVIEGLRQLGASSRDKKVLLVVSDGGDTASGHQLNDVLKAAETSDAIIYAIGLFDDVDPDRNPGVLKRLAHETGGQAFFPDEVSEVTAICQSIAHEIRTQYTIGYVPNRAAPEGSYRAIRVEARAPDGAELEVRTRAGYVAGQNRSGGTP